MAHLVLIGGGHAHMVTMANLHTFIERGHRVSVIGPSPHHYYSGMGPGMLGGTYSPDDIRFHTEKTVTRQGGSFLLDTVTRIDPQARRLSLHSGREVAYDVLSCNAGSFVPHALVRADAGDIFPVKPIEKLLHAQQRLVELAAGKTTTVAIVGGGPSAAEIAGNVIQLLLLKNLPPAAITIFAGSGFMKRFPEPVTQRVREILEQQDVTIQDKRVASITTGIITTTDGQESSADLIFLAAGVTPSTLFKESGLTVGPDNGLVVNRFLQAVDHEEIFGGGDCISFQEQPLDKVGVYAVRQNPVLFHNLLARLEGRPLLEFQPGGSYLLIFNLGNGLGVLNKGWLTFGGRLAFRIKDFIDRRFMRRFQ